jgi:hypothetical protein
VRTSQQDLLHLLAEYRRRLESNDDSNTAELLRTLIAEIEARTPPRDISAANDR